MPSEALQSTLASLAGVFGPDEALVACPDFGADGPEMQGTLPLATYEGPRAQAGWVLTAVDYASAAEQAEKHGVESILLLGSDANLLPAASFRGMAELLSAGADLAVPNYTLGPHDGLVTASLLYPMTRSLFGANIRYPLAADAGMSRRMAARMATIGQRQMALAQPDSLLWPVSEAAAASFSIREYGAGSRTLPPPETADFNALFTGVAGSLFTEVETKAAFWQRARAMTAAQRAEAPPSRTNGTTEMDDELPQMVDAFRLAYKNLQEIWSIVLPPQSLLALKKLSVSSPEGFTMAPGLWARIIYDFALAFHLRTLNRGHLLGALTPLYLAWVASTLRTVSDASDSALHVEETAAAFEREKPYLVARWRWPDRFNP
jgi:hypothetical protein